MKIPWIGGAFYSLDSLPADAQTCVNMYPEVDESGAGKSVARLRGTPGLTLFCTLPASPVLALWAGEGKIYAVAGTSPSHLYQVYSDGSVVDQGSVGSAATLPYSSEYAPALIFPNAGGTMLMVINGGKVWVDLGSPLLGGSGVQAAPNPLLQTQQITDLFITPFVGPGNGVQSNQYPFSQGDVGSVVQIVSGAGFTPGSYTITGIIGNVALLSSNPGTKGSVNGVANVATSQVQAITGTFLDSYGIVAPYGKQFYISAPDDYTNWKAIDFGSKEGYPDNIISLFADHELLWIFGDLQETEVWGDTGNANFPFQRLQAGGVIPFGLAAQWSVCQLGFNGLAWLAWSAGRGAVQAVYAQGLVPTRISTHAIEQVWRSYSNIQDCIAYSYIEDGHDFWVLHFPTADATWAYDITASAQMGRPMWHQRGYWDGSTLHRNLQRCHAYGSIAAGLAKPAYQNGRPFHFVGDHASGKIYVQSLTAYSDNGQAIKRQRACPHLSTENKWAFYSAFQLDAEVGVTSTAPAVTLDYSRDYGHTFINAVTVTPAAASGSAPDATGFSARLRWRRLGRARDVVFRITTTSVANISFTDAFIEVEPGNS